MLLLQAPMTRHTRSLHSLAPLAVLSFLSACTMATGSAEPTGEVSAAAKTSLNAGLNVDPSNANAGPVSDLQHLGVTRLRMTYRLGWGVESYVNYIRKVESFVHLQKIIFVLTPNALASGNTGNPFSPQFNSSYLACLNDYAAAFTASSGSCESAWQNWVWSYFRPEGQAAVGSIVSAFASAGIHVPLGFEVLYEPDDQFHGAVFTGGSPAHSSLAAGAMAYLLGQMTPYIRSKGAQAIVGGLDSGQTSYVQELGSAPYDAIAIHEYGTWPVARPDSCLGPYFGPTGGGFPKYQAVSGGRPVILTEFGYGSSTPNPNECGKSGEQTEADFVAAARNDPSLANQEAYFFGYSDVMQSGSGFGLITAQGAKKPAYYAF